MSFPEHDHQSTDEPKIIRTEDGYTFYRLSDGRYADSLEESSADMFYLDLKELSEAVDYTVVER
jgi:hypothetical protein